MFRMFFLCEELPSQAMSRQEKSPSPATARRDERESRNTRKTKGIIMNEAKNVKGKFPSPDTKSWYEYVWKAQQETPNRLEDAAKFLAGMISISLSIFLAADKTAFAKYSDSMALKAAILLWFLSLLFSFLVLFPWRYKYVSESVKNIKDMHRKIVRRKYVLLIMSSTFFLGALGMLGWLFFK